MCHSIIRLSISAMIYFNVPYKCCLVVRDKNFRYYTQKRSKIDLFLSLSFVT